MKNDNFTELLSCSHAVKLFFCLFCWIVQKPIGLAGKVMMQMWNKVYLPMVLAGV